MRRQRTSPDYQKAVGVFPCQNLSPECRIRAGLSRSHRGAIRHEPRGAGLAITARTLAAAPDLPAVLQPSDMAEPMYRRLGFARFTTFRTWIRRP